MGLGISGYEAYQVSGYTSGGGMEANGFMLPSSDTSKDVKIWCKK